MKKKLKLQQLRLDREITQEVMADRLAMTQATYSRKERGVIDITEEEWSKITEILGVNKEDVFEDNIRKNIISHNLNKQFLVLPASLLEKIDFLTRENQELKEKLRKYEDKDI
ncbi:helix-turn-helix transcriptional regulator [Flavobacterium sp. ANB]|uniref:helix-turn-helix transcriptional regulator n=1 Tax=unclassified Flavobacterium TaxID=196869 RepID=UPI0012B6F8E6|nr:MULTISPECIES: helix-turn-helix transcriptional regulator [unclassified Flavobacterium]MBF4516106.1 helix-turn-helix transcriptional regulator [Flavobacterium sp. ANB]MTD72203.1 helix-turn-helix domain-containing protein [Flavobacterium sp. LC2016-13]